MEIQLSKFQRGGPWSMCFDLASFTKRMSPVKCQRAECKKHQKKIARLFKQNKQKKILPFPDYLLANF